MTMISSLVRRTTLALGVASTFAVTDYQHTCTEARDVFQHVGCCADSAGYATNMLAEMQRVRVAYYEHLRETTDYIARAYNPRIKAGVNGSEVLPFLITTNRIILEEEQYSIVNDWWFDATSGKFMEIQFFDKRTVNTAVTSPLDNPANSSNYFLVMEHFTTLATHPDIGNPKIQAFFDTSETNYGAQNLRLGRLKSPEEIHFFDFFHNMSVAYGNPGISNKDVSDRSFAEILNGFQWLLLH